MDNSQTDPAVIFLHIPKTAGTTLNHILSRQYPSGTIYRTGKLAQKGVQAFRDMSAGERSRYRLIKGHMAFGLHRDIPGPSSYFTILRDPIERMISYYYFIMRTPDHPIYRRVQQDNLSMKETIELGLDSMMYNGHTRLLSGVWQTIGPGECTREHLALAKQNLTDHFDVVGLTEQFDETLLLLKKRYGWHNIFYTRQNVTGNRPKRARLPAESLAAIRQVNQLDIELYAFARQLFQQQLQQQGPRFAGQVRRFRLANEWMTPLYSSYWAMRKISVRVFVRRQLARLNSKPKES